MKKLFIVCAIIIALSPMALAQHPVQTQCGLQELPPNTFFSKRLLMNSEEFITNAQINPNDDPNLPNYTRIQLTEPSVTQTFLITIPRQVLAPDPGSRDPFKLLDNMDRQLGFQFVGYVYLNLGKPRSTIYCQETGIVQGYVYDMPQGVLMIQNIEPCNNCVRQSGQASHGRLSMN